jgi:hypothetical protein
VAEEEPLSSCNFNAFLQCFARTGQFEKFQANVDDVERQARDLWSVEGVEEFQAELIPPRAGKKSLMKAASLANKANSQWLQANYNVAHAGFTEAIAHLDHPVMLGEALKSRAKVLDSWGMKQHSELDNLKAQSLTSAVDPAGMFEGSKERLSFCGQHNIIEHRIESSTRTSLATQACTSGENVLSERYMLAFTRPKMQLLQEFLAKGLA